LALPLPVIDPSIYISRFTSLLDFGEETQKVAADAARLVLRFDKDWITHGRRPAGICGACILIAARMNHFRRSIAEIVQVVKIADITLRKRLEDFKNTPTGRLTIDDFRAIWLEEEHEPPAYYLARLPKKPARVKGESKRSKRIKLGPDGDEVWDADEEDEDDEDQAGPSNSKQEETRIDPRLEALADEATTQEITRYLDDPAITEVESLVPKRSGTVGAEGFSDLDDEELDAFILNDEEVRIKERVWIEFNKDFLEKTLERQLKMEADIKAGIGPKPPKVRCSSLRSRNLMTNLTS
jgi:transcription factor IIIB subunit 2